MVAKMCGTVARMCGMTARDTEMVGGTGSLKIPGIAARIDGITVRDVEVILDIRNTVGNIPMEWYQDFPHVGYDLDGRRIYKPLRSKDELDLFLEKMENPEYWRTVQDRQTGADVRLSEEQLELVQRLQRGQFGDVNFDPYEPSVDFFSHEVRIHPVTNRPADKRSFIPSLVEKEKVSKLVHAIKMGWIQPRKPKENVPTFYDLWAREDPNSILGRHKMHVPAPKIPLPGHEESYNPPPEFLLSPEEIYRGHSGLVRTLSVSPSGQWLVSDSRSQPVTQVTWHGKGDYWASVVRNPGSRQVLIHQSSRRWSQDPFRKSPGMIQCVQFHPIRPHFLVASQRSVRVYNLLRQELTKKLQSNCQWISSMAVHPAGEPAHHRRALRSVAFHRRYPLFASGSDDGTVIVCHGMVYSDLLQNPLLVPLKVLKGHAPALDLGVLDVAFHPHQPWLFSSGADGTVRLYT
ncbi:PREDICTED: ribosome biogenesis protein BOP1 [Sturnus vulgaris]|uniref:ribosome biogenesis protein BOP1 n=1 Tax=Sturnus vulgaris TaxID=9172 RepID=UPI00071A35AF|nr:PREDICTED: ribosome biogenesis protein BOP1 [Sturnus vulgaris]